MKIKLDYCSSNISIVKKDKYNNKKQKKKNDVQKRML